MDNFVHIPLDTPALDMFAEVGIITDRRRVPNYLKLFASQADRVLGEVCQLEQRGEMSDKRAGEFQQLIVDACAQVMCHPIIAGNNYLQRFAQGVTLAQARHEMQQFSVFGLQFDVAQAKLVANARTLEAYHERLQVLLNEKGIPYKEGFDGELTGQWSMDTVHFTWMQDTAAGLGLKFEDLGKIWIGQPGTKQFVETTFNTYASTDQNIAMGASLAIENWAANSLWTPWIAGMRKLNKTLDKPVHLGYLTYHEAQEAHHSQATLDELLETFQEPWFDADMFLAGAEKILSDGVQAYYESQLRSLPDKDDTWPKQACEPRWFDPSSLPRLAVPATTTAGAVLVALPAAPARRPATVRLPSRS
jgi:hypothetical protein